MNDQIIENIRMLSDIKQNRHALLLKIQALFFDMNFNINSIMSAINDLNESIGTRALLIQMLGRIALFQPQLRDTAINFLKKYYKTCKHDGNEQILEAILFFYFLLDRTYLLSFHFDNKRLVALRTRFLFINEELNNRFCIPERDAIKSQRIISLDRLFDNLIVMADLTRFAQVRDFISFCCKFPFLNDMEFLRNWSGIKNPAFFKEVTSSKIFIHDNKNIIYEPAERVKTDKFVFELSFQKKIHDLVREQKELQEKKQLFDRFVDSFLSMSDILNDTGICVIGYNGQHKLNKNASELLAYNSESDTYLDSLIANFIGNGAELERFIINGINIEAKISPLCIDDKNIGHIIVLKDITESEINKMFSAHDFKNSFNSVITTFRLLKDAQGLQEDEVKCLISGEKSIFKLKDQFDEIVSFRSDKLNLENDIDLCNILNRTIISSGAVLTAKSIKLSFPQAGDTILLNGDEKKISRIFENIISNAIKYSPENTAIKVYLEKTAKTVSVFIEDEGYGIEDSFGDKIFKMGSRQERDMHKVSGSGLGLAIVKKFVSMHGGTISFTKNAGKGTTFKVTLPFNRTNNFPGK